jgi:hypothetical protein
MGSGESLIRGFIAEAFLQISGRTTVPEIEVTFRRVAGLNHSIRIRERKIYVRISDILITAPPDVLRSLAFILVARLFRQRAQGEHLRRYREYTYRPEVVREADLARLHQGRQSQVRSAAGRVHDLHRLFVRLNQLYFRDSLPRPLLEWSQRRSMRVLGHHDDLLEKIVISRSLDDERIPEFVVEFVLYHEMLHLKHPSRIVDGRRIYHTPAFRRDERRYARYEEALDALESIE